MPEVTHRSIDHVLAFLGDDAHPAEIEVVYGHHVRIVVRPKHSSRTFVLSARITGATEI
jgi:hypothetical protein